MNKFSAASRFFVAAGSAVALAGCSLPGVSSGEHEPGRPPGHREAVEAVAWTWAAPRGSEAVAVHRMGEGVLVLLDNGAVALSGETGEELWSYRDTGRDFLSAVTDNDAYVVLHDEEEPRTLVLEKDTGKVIHEYTLDLLDIDYAETFAPNPLAQALPGITGNSWLVRWEDSVSSYDLGTGEAVWTAEDVPRCPYVGQVDDLVVWDEVAVAATTCFEQPEDREDSVVTVKGWDFTSEFVGLNPETGEELWRVEHSIGESPYDSLEREIVPRPGNLVLIRHAYPHKWGISLLDVEAGEAADLKETELLWTSPDGSLLGLWDTETGEYRIQDRSGNVEGTQELGGVSMSSDLVAEGLRVGLAGGVLYLVEQTGNPSGPEGFGRFEGIDGSAVLTLDTEGGMTVHDAISVPGAVVVHYDAAERETVMGLR